MYPGDSIAVSFNLNTTTRQWSNEWVTIPGSAGVAAGETYKVTDFAAPDQDVCKSRLPFAMYELRERGLTHSNSCMGSFDSSMYGLLVQQTITNLTLGSFHN